MQRYSTRIARAFAVGTAGVALSSSLSLAMLLSFGSVAHADGQVVIQVSGTDDVLSTVQVALLDASGVDVASAACTSAAAPGLLTFTCAGLADGSYRAVVVAPGSVDTVSEFCSPADPSLDPEPDGTIRLRPEADLFICTTQLAAIQQASNPPPGTIGLLPVMGASPALAAVALLLVTVGGAMSRAARRPVR